MGLSDLFVDPNDLPEGGYGFVQLLFLMCAYGYILYRASKLIADGSEMLMLVLNPGLVGGLVLPVMGAVPDGAIVLFSGLGPDAQEQLKVGVGTLAGSTIMLLTIPWTACAILGRVPLTADGSKARYGVKDAAPAASWGAFLTGTGVQPSAVVLPAAKLMLLTALTYLVIQGPSFAFQDDSNISSVASKEKYWALAGLLLAILAFLGYSAYCVLSADAQERQKERIIAARKSAVNHKIVSLATVLNIEMQAAAEAGGDGASGGSHSALLEEGKGRHGDARFAASTAVLRKLFDKYDIDGSGELDKGEVKAMLAELGFKPDAEFLRTFMRDVGGADQKIQFDEFEGAIRKFVASEGAALVAGGSASGSGSARNLGAASRQQGSLQAPAHEEEAGEEDEDEEDEEEELAHLTPSQIKLRAFIILAAGVGLVTLFSDPMVDVLSTLGARLNIGAFYVSFVITPIVSNASELISSILQARKKSQATIDVTYSQLLGAATMNNTFCLAIFLVLVFVKGLAWEFSAEVMAILLVEAALFILTVTNKNGVLPIWKSTLAALLYPGSLLFVYLLENVAGWN